MNIICMGGRTVGPAVAWDLVETFLAAEFSGAARHLRRLGKVASLEASRHATDRGCNHFQRTPMNIRQIIKALRPRGPLKGGAKAGDSTSPKE